MTILAHRTVPTAFSEILARVMDAGLLKKKPSFYVIRLIIFSVIASGLWVGGGFLSFFTNSNSAWILLGFLMAGLLGVLSAQYGFIAHEAAHRQIFRNNKANDWVGLILANLFAGLS